jgi:hypothetical protein
MDCFASHLTQKRMKMRQLLTSPEAASAVGSCNLFAIMATSDQHIKLSSVLRGYCAYACAQESDRIRKRFYQIAHMLWLHARAQ